MTLGDVMATLEKAVREAQNFKPRAEARGAANLCRSGRICQKEQKIKRPL